MTSVAVLPHLAAATYRQHRLHGSDLAWVEKNCYVDVWIEVIHALDLDPMAMLPFVLGLDFEDDQWTFFKPSLDELRRLYGIDVHELNVWRPLAEHALEHLSKGKMISTEADAYWLPDTAGTDYRDKHTKSTIIIQALDVESRWLGYFHNAGYYELQGEDFEQIFRLEPTSTEFQLPLYAELIRTDRLVRREAQALQAMSLDLLRSQLARRPFSNPILRFRDRFPDDMRWIERGGLPLFHQWAFGTLRQLGAAFELAALYLKWLSVEGSDGRNTLGSASESFSQISTGSKTLLLKAARAINARRPLDAHDSLTEMAEAWDRGMDALGTV